MIILRYLSEIVICTRWHIFHTHTKIKVRGCWIVLLLVLRIFKIYHIMNATTLISHPHCSKSHLITYLIYLSKKVILRCPSHEAEPLWVMFKLLSQKYSIISYNRNFSPFSIFTAAPLVILLSCCPKLAACGLVFFDSGDLSMVVLLKKLGQSLWRNKTVRKRLFFPVVLLILKNSLTVQHLNKTFLQ